jgi:hypothetical protein
MSSSVSNKVVYELLDAQAQSIANPYGPMAASVINSYMTQFYEAYQLKYIVARPPQPGHSNMFASLLASQGRPLLTLDGYMHWILIGILLDPDTQYTQINKLLKKIPLRIPHTNNLLPQSIPRSAFPSSPDPQTVAYVSDRMQNLGAIANAQAGNLQQQSQINLQLASIPHGGEPPTTFQPQSSGFAPSDTASQMMNMRSAVLLNQARTGNIIAGRLHGWDPRL